MSADRRWPWLAELLHQFPHLDLSFQPVNSTFNPQNAHYRESLVFWAAIPVLWLLLTLLTFLIYFCYRCCCQKEIEEKRKRAACLKWSMAILALLTCAAVGVGFYGNEESHKGITQFAKAAEDADATVTDMKAKLWNYGGVERPSLMLKLESNINMTVEGGIQGLMTTIENDRTVDPMSVPPAVAKLREAAETTRFILKDVEIINSKSEHVDLSDVVKYTKEYGFYRWLGLIILLCWEVFLCLLVLLAIGKSSKCTLLMFCAFGIFTLVLCWICAGFHLGGSVGVGDFCLDPENFFESLASKNLEKDVMRYYLKCKTEEITNPFSKTLKEALDRVTTGNATIREAVTGVRNTGMDGSKLTRYLENVNKGYDNTVQTLQQLTALTECTNIHKDYRDGVEGVCTLALPGFVFLLLSAVVTGLLLTILVLMASCAWRHISKNYLKAERRENSESKGYTVIDDDEPRLSIPDNSSPTYYSFSRSRQGNPREHVAMQRRGSPPPAYNSNEFYRQHYRDQHPDSPQHDISGDSNA